jgi:(hydroxyamino)benzene mutase
MNDLTIFLGQAGFVLFTLGLFIGVAIPKLRNSRMGLSAHLTAVQTGPALIAFALFWEHLAVPAAWAPILIYSLLASSFILVAGILLAAIYGASEALPIAGGDFKASQARERTVSLLVKGSSVLMALSCAIICYFSIAGWL